MNEPTPSAATDQALTAGTQPQTPALTPALAPQPTLPAETPATVTDQATAHVLFPPTAMPDAMVINQASPATVPTLEEQVATLTAANARLTAETTQFPTSPAAIRAMVDFAPYESLRNIYEAGEVARSIVNERWTRGK